MLRFLTALLIFCTSLSTAYAQVQTTVKPTAEPVSMTGYLLQGIFGLLVVLGLMYGAWWILRRTGFNRDNTGVNMKVVGGISIGNRERVMIVEGLIDTLSGWEHGIPTVGTMGNPSDIQIGS